MGHLRNPTMAGCMDAAGPAQPQGVLSCVAAFTLQARVGVGGGGGGGGWMARVSWGGGGVGTRPRGGGGRRKERTLPSLLIRCPRIPETPTNRQNQSAKSSRLGGGGGGAVDIGPAKCHPPHIRCKLHRPRPRSKANNKMPHAPDPHLLPGPAQWVLVEMNAQLVPVRVVSEVLYSAGPGPSGGSDHAGAV